MSVIKQFQKVLIADYLKEFTSPVQDGNWIGYKTVILYDGFIYYLKDIDFIQSKTNTRLNELNYLLIEAKSELFHELAELPKTSDKANLVKLYIDSFAYSDSLLNKYASIESDCSWHKIEIKTTVAAYLFGESTKELFSEPSIENKYESENDFIDQQNEKWTKLIAEFLNKISSINDDFISFLNDQYKSLESQKFTPTTTEFDKIKWLDKESHLAYIMATLANCDYIETPKKSNGEINYRQFARQIQQVFNTNMKESSLEKYLNLDSDKAQETHNVFKKENFHIPHIKLVN
jgi:hypothetical protein